MRDRASTNEVAMRTVMVLYPRLLDVGCFSHTLNLVGEHFHTTTLSEFGIRLFFIVPRLKCYGKNRLGHLCKVIAQLCGGADGRFISSLWCSLEMWNCSLNAMEMFPLQQEVNFYIFF